MTIRAGTRARAVDTLVILGYTLGAFYVLSHLWRDPNGRYLTLNFQDSFTFEWFLTHATELFTKGQSPFFSSDVNYPMGVNLMANTSILTLALPLTPVTLWLGPGVSFAIISTLAIAGTAAGWYWVLTRDFGRSRIAGAVAGAFLGFAPAIISQIAGHPNLAGQGLIPLIIAAVLRMRHPGKVRRHGLVLAGLVVLQAGINEELLLFTAMALGVFLIVYVPWRELPGHARVMLPKFGVTLLAAGAVLAYPLYFQFFGPQVYHGLDSGVRAINLDVMSYVNFGRYAIAGDVEEAIRLNRGSAAEENSFFGLPLVLLVIAGTVALWRNRLARALFVTGLVFMVMSLGDVIRYNGVDYPDKHGPWKWIAELPLFDSVVPTRLGLIVTATVGVGIALLIDKLVVDRLRPLEAPAAEPLEADDPRLSPIALTGSVSDGGVAETAVSLLDPPVAPPRRPRGRSTPPPVEPDWARLMPAIVWSILILGALIPLIPRPQPADPRPPLPGIFTNGNWRTELPPHPIVAMLPGGWTENIGLMRLSTETGYEVRFTSGYFLGPNDTVPEDKNAHFGPGQRETTGFLGLVRDRASLPGGVVVTQQERDAMRADLKFWHATNIMMVVGWNRNEDIIRAAIDDLVAPEAGRGRLVGGVWLWDVRPITAG